MRITRQQKIANWVFIAPALFLYVFWTVLPTIRGFYYSFTEFDGLSKPKWVGFKNFLDLPKDRDLFLIAIKNNLILLSVPGVLIVTISLLFAFLIHREIKGSKVFKTLFFFPNIMSAVSMALLWTLLYSPSSFGIINNLLKFYGAKQPIPFTSSDILVWSVIPMILWGAVGFNMLLYLAAMQRIPEVYYEAALLDGASRWQSFRNITIPFIWEILVVSFIFIVIGMLRIFEPIWIMEGQSGNPRSNTIATLMYSSIMAEYRVGYGTAIAVVLFFLTVLLVLLVRRVTRKEVIEY
jgi:raffinose/stachyose/melibiose transport system permease protein